MSNFAARMIATLALLVSSPAWAACEVSADGPAQVRFGGESNAGYNSFARANYSADFTIRIANRDSDEPCTILLSLQRPVGRQALENGAGALLDYEILEASSRAPAIDPDTAVGPPPNAQSVTLRPGQRAAQHYRFFVPPGQIVPSGAYSDEVVYRILDAATLEVLTERGFQLQTRVSQQMAIFVSDAMPTRVVGGSAGGRRGRMDFGQLTSNETQTMGVTVLSNDDYSLHIESENGGALFHELYGREARIEYAASFGGRSIDLKSGEATLFGYPATSRTGTSQSLSVTIGTVGAARAGQYSDRLTITVQPDA